MDFGHNLRYMPLFGIPSTVFCMFFQRASFICLCPRADFGTENWILNHPVDILAQGPFWVNFARGPETMICDEIILWWVGRGIPPAQMNCMVPGIHLGVLLCPQAPLFIKRCVIQDFPGKLESPPAYFPWWPPIFLGGSCGALWHNVSP